MNTTVPLTRIRHHRNEAERKAWDSLARYKFPTTQSLGNTTNSILRTPQAPSHNYIITFSTLTCINPSLTTRLTAQRIS